MGRPKGSKNKPKTTKKRGRPPKKSKIILKNKDVENVDVDELIFNSFINMYSSGLYDFGGVCLRIGKSVEEMEEIINSKPTRIEEFNNAIDEAKIASDKDELVKKALKSLNEQVEGKEKIKEIGWRYNNGVKQKAYETVKEKGVNFKAVKEVLENFTDAFGQQITPEKLGKIFISFNKYLYNETNDVELVEKLLVYEEEFINYMFIKNKN